MGKNEKNKVKGTLPADGTAPAAAESTQPPVVPAGTAISGTMVVQPHVPAASDANASSSTNGVARS
jgi:hypothetical protein